jgi:phosphoglycerate dehydrogenase-like enzyme
LTDRLLVLDLAAKARSSALDAEAEQRITAATPAGWRVQVVRAETISDGDGASRPSDEAMAAIRDAEVYYGYGIPKLLFREARKLRWVHSASAGVGAALYSEMIASDVQLTNASGVHAEPVAEYVAAGVLHFLRGFDYAVNQQRRAEWNKAEFTRLDSVVREMDTVRALVIGVGAIGGAIGRRLTALGARCTGVRRRVELGPPPGFERVVGLDQLDAVLPEHDVVVLAAPLTAATAGILTAERLDRLPRTAIVVNVARGAMLDEGALTQCLAGGRIRGAVLDVFQSEPLAPESPLWQLPQVLITPHVSPASPGRYWPRQVDIFLDNWGRYVRGEPLRNAVNKLAGY